MTHAFPLRLKSIRSKRGLSKSALARRLGVSVPTLWGWEQGRSMPRAENMRALADLLDVPEAFLANGRAQALDWDALSQEEGLTTFIEFARSEIAHRAGVDPDKVTIAINY